MDKNIMNPNNAFRDKCSYADKYQGTRPPTCGCRACWKKFRQVQGISED